MATSASAPWAPPCNATYGTLSTSADSTTWREPEEEEVKRLWVMERPAKGWYVDLDACNERTGWAIVDRVVVEAGCGERTGMLNSRAIRPFIHVNGMYLERFGLTRHFWWEKIIWGERPLIMIWFPRDITLDAERKWCGEDGTCQESWKRKKIDLPLIGMTTWTWTLPIPSMTISVPKTVRWSRCKGTYVVNKEQSLKIWDGRVVSITR